MQDLELTQSNLPERLPLSTDQYRIWFLHQLDGSLNHFNINFAFNIEGPLNLDSLHSALTDLARRHETMRTSFLSQDGVPYLNVAPESDYQADMPVYELDATQWGDSGELDKHIRDEFNKLGKEPFKLDRDHMFRVTVYKLSETSFRMLFTIHHIIADFDSLKLLLKELFHCYRVRVKGDVEPLMPLTVQYSDYAFWQNERLRSGKLDGQLKYWQEELSGELPVLRMPMDRPRGVMATNNGATKRITFSQTLTDKLTELSKQNSVTLFITLISAYQVLLHKYTKQEDINIGTPITTRNQEELKDLVGLFINTLVLKSDLTGDPSFLELLQRNRKIAFSAFSRQDIPYEKLVSELNPDRNLNYNLFFQTMVMFLEPDNHDMEMVPGVSVSPFEIDKKTTTFELTLSFSYVGTALTLLVDYNTDLYNESTIAYLLTRFEYLLDELTNSPSKPIKSVNLLKPSEREEMLAAYSGTQTERLGCETFNTIWAKRVEDTPDLVAIVEGNTSLTYRQVDDKVSLLARKLVGQGVSAGSLIPVVANRNIDMVVAFLAVLKCGAAYVPLNPSHPVERLANIVAQTKSRLVILTQENSEITSAVACPTVSVKTLMEAPMGTAEVVDSIQHPLDLAYVIFTSGSTGSPKGVMVSHDSIVNHCENMVERFELNSFDRVLQFTAPSFDVSVQEIFPTLMQGAALVLWDQDGIEGTETFFSWLEDKKVSVLNLTTAHWHNLVADATHDNLNFPESLKLVIVGGEKASVATLRDWSSMVEGKIRWINDYGLTETTVTATMYEHSNSTFEADSVPIGTPLNNVSIYVLDEQMNPVPRGIYGDIYIGGRGVAMGYYGNPELTKEKFTKNPFSSGRIFNTGDVGRINLDGSLEFDSRNDLQVKIRGNRVELEEIEKHLMMLDNVKKVFLRVCSAKNNGQKSIAAYLVLSTQTVGASEIKERLSQILPDYMVPSSFVVMDDFPLTSHGKVDQKQLPEPNMLEVRTTEQYIAPVTETEQKIALLWADLLGREQIGRASSFFDIGGDSLIATTLISRLKSECGINIPLRLLFEHPKLQDLAGYLDQHTLPTNSEKQNLIKLQTAGEGTPLFYVHPVGGTVSCYFGLSRRLGQSHPFYALQAHAMTYEDYSFKTVEHMAELYLEEIRAVQPHGPYRLGGWSMGGFIAYEIACLLKAQGEEVIELSMIDTYLTKTRVADEKIVMFNFVLQLAALPGKSVSEEYLLSWQDKTFEFEDVCTELRKLNLIPEETPDDYILHLFNVYMATVEAFKKYDPNPEAPIDVNQAVLFRAHDSHEEQGIWPKLVNNVELHHINADHFGIVHHPEVSEVISRISRVSNMEVTK